MSLPSLSFRDQLSGEHAFYKHRDYLRKTREDLNAIQPLPASYTWNTGVEGRVVRLLKVVTGLYRWIHVLVGKFALLPASTPMLVGKSKDSLRKNRWENCAEETTPWRYKRITIKVDDYLVDGMIVGTEQTLENDRWVLLSNGNGEFYEDRLWDISRISSDNMGFLDILRGVNGNGILFNYPGVGESSGLPSRQAMEKAYRAMLTFLEDGRNGIGAKEIIGYGHSIGGGVQGDALKKHVLKEGISYVFVRSRTFSTLSNAASDILRAQFNFIRCKPLGWLVWLLGWNMDSKLSPDIPEIVMQTAKVEESGKLRDSKQIIGDGMVSSEASLAKDLFNDPAYSNNKNKVLIGVWESHNRNLNPETVACLTSEINSILTKEEERVSRSA